MPILTTRGPRRGDDGEYHYLGAEAFLCLQRAGNLAACTRIPSQSEERFYGYRHRDFEAVWNKGKLPIAITDLRLLEGLAEMFGRQSIVSVGLLPPGETEDAMLDELHRRLCMRGRDSEASMQERLQNAKDDIRLCRERPALFDAVFINDDLDETIDKLERLIINAPSP